MNIVLYLSSKYLKFKANERGISAISVIALLTVVISTAAAIVILSASNGFHYSFMKKLMAKDAHLTILGPGKGIDNYQQYITEIGKIKGVTGVYPYADRQALLKGTLNTWGALIKGIPSNLYSQDADFSNQVKIVDGAFDFHDPMSIILGETLAENLGASIGSSVQVTVFSDDFGSLQYHFTVKGIFSAGYAEYDANLAFISFPDAQLIGDSIGYAYGLAIKVADPFNVEQYVKPIQKICPYHAWTWKTLNRNNLFAIENEKMLVYIILSFFFIVVAFNILSTMIAMVLSKKEEIGILKAMGLSPKKTLQVFLFDGFLIGAGGGTAGVVAGLFITSGLNDILHFIEHLVDFVNFSAYHLVHLIRPIPAPTKFEFFRQSVYYITQFPIQIQFGDIVFVMLLAVTLSTLAVIPPALKAARLRPVEVLRND
jgi:lipoprotein-releasing system permease protein